MSDSEKLRKIYGSILLTSSFIFFALAVCGIWSMFVTYLGTIIMLAGIVPLVFLTFSFLAAIISYETYVGVSESEIKEFDSARLKKLHGIFQLICAFVLLALAISILWSSFVFFETLSPILLILALVFGTLLKYFYYCIINTINAFMGIEKLVRNNY